MLTAPAKWLTELVDTRGGQAGRYLIVSALNFANHQIVLFVANSIWGWGGGWANAFAACVAAGPAYYLSRRWVWELSGPHSMRDHVIPFWGLALVGLIVSSIFAQLADTLRGAGPWVNLASILGYFVVWVAKFFLLDRIFMESGDRT